MKKPAPNPSDKKRARRESARTRVTLAVVAKRAGVSRATASQVLNDRANCWASEATRKRIREAAEALAYRPNLSARALRLRRTHVIGIIAPGLIATRTGGLTEAASNADYTVALSSHANDARSQDLAIRRFLACGVDGLAVYPVDMGPHSELRRLVESGFPIVTFEGASLLDFPCDDVSVDHQVVGQLQARHVLQMGCRRLCLANTFPEARINAIREAAVRHELDRVGLSPPIEMRVSRCAMQEVLPAESLLGPMRDFLKAHTGSIDAVIAFDSMASLAVRILLELGLRVPEDVAVVGAGDSILASYGVMPLTSVHTEDTAAGAKAFDLLMERISGDPHTPFRQLISPARLIARKSTPA